MPYITNAKKDGDWVKLGKQFVDTVALESSSLGLTPAQVTGLSTTFDNFDTAYTDLETQKATLESAVSVKDSTKASFEALVRRYAKQFRGNVTVPDALLELLNVAPHTVKPSNTSPTQPLALVVTTNSVGQVFLKWNRNGNRSGTTFWIQTKSSANGPWVMVNTTTTSKFTLENYPAGTAAWFRVVAVRRNLHSAPSDFVTIYSAEDESSNLSIAA
ncbi:MAG: fibronectin type III domain-containing protein [Armatimonadetes bacterium]|nr:fibronectin type III domain-containing protein [Armatimonadota bacterium]